MQLPHTDQMLLHHKWGFSLHTMLMWFHFPPQGKKGNSGDDGNPGVKGSKVLVICFACVCLIPISLSFCFQNLNSLFLTGWERAQWTSWSKWGRGQYRGHTLNTCCYIIRWMYTAVDTDFNNSALLTIKTRILFWGLWQCFDHCLLANQDCFYSGQARLQRRAGRVWISRSISLWVS